MDVSKGTQPVSSHRKRDPPTYATAPPASAFQSWWKPRWWQTQSIITAIHGPASHLSLTRSQPARRALSINTAIHVLKNPDRTQQGLYASTLSSYSFYIQLSLSQFTLNLQSSVWQTRSCKEERAPCRVLRPISMDRAEQTHCCLAYCLERPLNPTEIWAKSNLYFGPEVTGTVQELPKASSRPMQHKVSIRLSAAAPNPAAATMSQPPPQGGHYQHVASQRGGNSRTGKWRMEKSNEKYTAAGQWDLIFKSNLSLCSQWERNATICMTRAKWTE